MFSSLLHLTPVLINMPTLLVSKVWVITDNCETVQLTDLSSEFLLVVIYFYSTVLLYEI